MRFEQIPGLKEFRRAQVFALQEGNWNLTFTVKVDFEAAGTASELSLTGSGSLWDTATYDVDTYGDENTVIGFLIIDKIGDFFQWRVANSGLDETFTLRGVNTWIEPMDRIGPL